MEDVSLVLVICLIAVIVIGCYLIYESLKTKVVIEVSKPSIPKFADLNFFFGTESEEGLPTRFLDIKKGYFEFPFNVKNLFNEKVRVKICPKIVTKSLDLTSSIEIDCLELELNKGEGKKLNIKIPFSGKEEELLNSTKTVLRVEVEYTGLISSFCDLYLFVGYPYCEVSDSASLKISPDLRPNPINLDKDEKFSVYLKIRKFSEFLELERVEILPIETKVRIISYGKERVETITLEENYSSELSYVVSLPEDYIFLHEFNAPKIRVEEGEKKEYINIRCEDEAVKKLKICELRFKDEKVDQAFRKLTLELKLFFLSKRSIEENLQVTK
ncbi:MAG: hypothetical protein QW040_00485 [Candidatus Aenigmatarchaeota archaeon]